MGGKLVDTNHDIVTKLTPGKQKYIYFKKEEKFHFMARKDRMARHVGLKTM